MEPPTKTFTQFQNYVWAKLPPRRTRAGREVVFDLVSLAVQEWPSDLLSQVQPGSKEEGDILRGVVSDIKRQAHVLYGEKRFGSLWIIVLQFVIPIIVEIVLEWWRSRKLNRGKIALWRRRWDIRKDD